LWLHCYTERECRHLLSPLKSSGVVLQ
jgi:alpha-tubulin suppressor-like RCC1 family protein